MSPETRFVRESNRSDGARSVALHGGEPNTTSRWLGDRTAETQLAQLAFASAYDVGMNNVMNRRVFLAGAVGAVGVGGFASQAGAAEMTAQEKANVQVVNEFCAAWSAKDLNKILSLFADTGAYRMTETAEPLKGRDAVAARIKPLIERVERFDVLDTFARGPMVINERIDRFASGTLKAWHGVGVFFLKDGKIVEWSDYTMSTERA